MTDAEKAAAAAASAAGSSGAAAWASGEGSKQVPIAALHDERNRRQALEAKIKQMESVFGDQITYDSAGNLIPKQPQQPQQPVQQQNWQAELDRLWQEDPRKAMQQEMGATIQWYDQVNTAVETQMDELSAKHPDFQTYRGHVRGYLRKLPVDQRARPGIVEAAYFLHKGQNLDKVLEEERRRANERYSSGEAIQGINGGSGNSYAGDAGAGARRYSQDEINVAKMYGKTPEAYFGPKA